MYLNTPKEMIASAGNSPWLLLVGIMLITIISSFTLFYYFIYPQTHFIKKNGILGAIFFVLLAISLVIPIRGGFQLAPLNVSNVYFSKNNFANHAAINVSWNFFSSLMNKESSIASDYDYFSDEEAFQIARKQYYPTDHKDTTLLRVKRPNIILITWESFTAKVVAETKGLKGVTPNFSKLTKEGILLTNMYASADRSDKGLVAILSGYPALVQGSIINVPKKAEKLPSLAHTLKHEKYQTAFYYGGEIEFANMRSYFVKNFDTVISEENFDKKDITSSWGVPDHILLKRFSDDLKSIKQPFFYSLFTLSSHEPFDFPGERKYPGTNKDSLFLSSIAYTDKAIGEFVESAKQQPWWDNTIIIITADHGTSLPGKTFANRRKRFHIPFLMIGGALKTKGITIDKVCSQTDISKTLLQLLNIPSDPFVWSNDILNPAFPGHAYYVFKYGFGYITDEHYLIFDHKLKSVIYSNNSDTTDLVNAGKALTQTISKDYKMK